ncbi:hypothetical protein H9P43_003277 [Blastocladiella emersonii ATCC 22665]|nr:hypothetical protein H9P43_003277 [Blastocladiella emersonii ATCC 22665]
MPVPDPDPVAPPPAAAVTPEAPPPPVSRSGSKSNLTAALQEAAAAAAAAPSTAAAAPVPDPEMRDQLLTNPADSHMASRDRLSSAGHRRTLSADDRPAARAASRAAASAAGSSAGLVAGSAISISQPSLQSGLNIHADPASNQHPLGPAPPASRPGQDPGSASTVDIQAALDARGGVSFGAGTNFSSGNTTDGGGAASSPTASTAATNGAGGRRQSTKSTLALAGLSRWDSGETEIIVVSTKKCAPQQQSATTIAGKHFRVNLVARHRPGTSEKLHDSPHDRSGRPTVSLDLADEHGRTTASSSSAGAVSPDEHGSAAAVAAAGTTSMAVPVGSAAATATAVPGQGDADPSADPSLASSFPPNNIPSYVGPDSKGRRQSIRPPVDNLDLMRLRQSRTSLVYKFTIPSKGPPSVTSAASTSPGAAALLGGPVTSDPTSTPPPTLITPSGDGDAPSDMRYSSSATSSGSGNSAAEQAMMWRRKSMSGGQGSDAGRFILDGGLRSKEELVARRMSTSSNSSDKSRRQSILHDLIPFDSISFHARDDDDEDLFATPMASPPQQSRHPQAGGRPPGDGARGRRSTTPPSRTSHSSRSGSVSPLGSETPPDGSPTRPHRPFDYADIISPSSMSQPPSPLLLDSPIIHFDPASRTSLEGAALTQSGADLPELPELDEPRRKSKFDTQRCEPKPTSVLRRNTSVKSNSPNGSDASVHASSSGQYSPPSRASSHATMSIIGRFFHHENHHGPHTHSQAHVPPGQPSGPGLQGSASPPEAGKRVKKSSSFMEKLDKIVHPDHHHHHPPSAAASTAHVSESAHDMSRRDRDDHLAPDYHPPALAEPSRSSSPVMNFLSRKRSDASAMRDNGRATLGGSTRLSRSNSETSLHEKYGVAKEFLGKGANATVMLAHKVHHPSHHAHHDGHDGPVGHGELHGAGLAPGGGHHATGPYDTSDGPQERLFAIKKFRKRRKNETERDYIKKLSAEFCISSSLHHPHVIETVDLIQDEQSEWCEVMEYMAGGDLFSRIANGRPMEESEINCLFAQLIDGVAYLHSIGVAHRDLKPENLLLDGDGRTLKIADFGTSEVFRVPWATERRRVKGVCGSDPYIAPEEWTGNAYEPDRVDVWATGIIYFVMLYKTIPWKAAQNSDPHYAHFIETKAAHQFEYIDDLPASPHGPRDLLYKILEPSPVLRITMEKIKEDPWFMAIETCHPGRPNFAHAHFTANQPS